MGRAKLQKLPCGQVLEPDGTVELKPSLSWQVYIVRWLSFPREAGRVLHHQGPGVGFNNRQPAKAGQAHWLPHGHDGPIQCLGDEGTGTRFCWPHY